MIDLDDTRIVFLFLTNNIKYFKDFFNEIESIENLTNTCCNSIAYKINNFWIIKFSKSKESLDKIKNEIILINFLKNLIKKIDLSVPIFLNIDGVDLSIQKSFAGSNLDKDFYLKLNESKKNKFAKQLAEFLLELHSIPLNKIENLNLNYWDRYDKIFPSKEIIIKTLKNDSNLNDEQKNNLFKFLEEYFNLKIDFKIVLGHFDILAKNLKVDFKTGKIIGIFDFGDSGKGFYEYEFSNMDFGGRDLLIRISKFYPINVENCMKHRLFSKIAFYINFLNGIEKIQKTCYQKLIIEMQKYF